MSTDSTAKERVYGGSVCLECITEVLEGVVGWGSDDLGGCFWKGVDELRRSWDRGGHGAVDLTRRRSNV